MGTITYTAVDRGRLVSGHSEGTQYTFEINMNGYDPDEDIVSEESVSLSGRVMTVFHRFDQFASISTPFIKDAAINNQMIEFYDSIKAGEEFTIDPYGTIASPAEPVNAIRNGRLDRQRYATTQIWKYSFSIRIL